MEESFLDVINDRENRVFPLNYKYVKIKEMPQIVKDRLCISIDLYNTTKYETEPYHKPISKLL